MHRNSGLVGGGGGDGSRESKLTRIAQERQRKEATADKIQQVLREIQAKFHELSIREPLQRSLRTNALPSSESSNTDARRVSEMIAKQKEAIFQKERSLVEQRNKLWHEIAALEAEEATLMQQQPQQQAYY